MALKLCFIVQSRNPVWFYFSYEKKTQKLEPENIWNFFLVHGQILQHQWFKPGIEYEVN